LSRRIETKADAAAVSKAASNSVIVSEIFPA
jgi:hypothetical protein